MIIFSYLLYYLVIIPVSLLPFRLLYVISDVLYFFLFSVLGYRKKVVIDNIRKSFPQNTPAEHEDICKKFYHHLCDLVVESIKVFTISEKQVQARMVCRNPELLNTYYNRSKSVIIAGGHFNNWELFAVAVDSMSKHQMAGIYKKLTSKFFDAKMQETRGKYGLKMISTKDVKTFFEEEKNNLTATIFGIDQSPSNPHNSYWLSFLHQDTAVLFGTEKFAKEYNYPVVFGRILKIKRGYYEYEWEVAIDEPLKTSYGEITEKATAMLEKDILQQPEFWLWSHRRWKHKKPHAQDEQEVKK